MMGGHHAVSGTAAWMAAAGSAQIAGRATGLDLLELEATQVLAGAVVTTGAALLPDIDHPRATIARSAGGISKAVASVVGGAAGHRGATHTLLAMIGFTMLAATVARLDWHADVPMLGQVQLGAVAVVTVMCAFATRALKIISGLLLPWIVGLGSGLLVAAFAPVTGTWLPVAIGLGVLVHLVGDLLTIDGIPFPTWPLVVKPPKRVASAFWHADGNIAVPILGRAGSAREWVLCVALSVYAAVALGSTVLAAVASATSSW